jgi:hypothetical protein
MLRKKIKDKSKKAKVEVLTMHVEAIPEFIEALQNSKY